MNRVVKEMQNYLAGEITNIAQDIVHYGIKRRSGRYPYGSGENPYQHSGDFLSRVEELAKQGLSEKEIADELGTSTTQLRTQKAIAKSERRNLEVARARDLRDKGYSLNEIAEQMGYANDSSIRALLNSNTKDRYAEAKATAQILKDAVDSKGMIDVGVGVERELGVSREKLQQAIYILEEEGYLRYGGRVPQVTNPGKYTTLSVLCPPGTEHKEIFDYGNVHQLEDYVSYDGGESYRKAFEYPSSFDSSRLLINYAEDGGIDKDGVIELRRGVEDISLGDSTYAQVRIMVDGTHYLKGMAVYADDLPDGVDIRFNTNKKKGTAMEDVLKPVKDDPDNPFGALIKEHGGQRYFDDPDGKYTDPITGKKQSLSVINKTREEGDWGEWSKTLASQFLAKQSMKLINQQLNLTIADKKAEFDEICNYTNPTVKKALLSSFADECDYDSVHLQAAALPRQKYQVILPLTTIKDNEVYAPNFDDGETIALVRYPHGGTFEIPILKVNNKQAEGRKILTPTAADAIGVNSKVAARLSGADFDGDTVLCIPVNSKAKIISTSSLKGLEGFEPKTAYGADSGTAVKTDSKGNEYYTRNGKIFKRLSKASTQIEMGKVSNLIADMTLKGATEEELAKAVRHSMVVIDAHKHKLDYKASEVDNDIATLKSKYQRRVDDDGSVHEGASTLITRAKAPVQVLKRKGSPKIDKETGEVSYKEVEETYIDKRGKTKTRTQASTQMAETKDARTLSSGTAQEEAYAKYANELKSLANKARKEMVNTGKIAYSTTARNTYSEEVKRLEAKLNVALKNAPRERAAQLMANSIATAKIQDNPDLQPSDKKKIKQQALTSAREKVGASRTNVTITDKEWEAIQAGAIHENTLKKIIDNSNIDEVKQRAMPRQTTTLSTAKINKMKAMKASGYTTAEIAKALGVSSSTVSRQLNGKE